MVGESGVPQTLHLGETETTPKQPIPEYGRGFGMGDRVRVRRSPEKDGEVSAIEDGWVVTSENDPDSVSVTKSIKEEIQPGTDLDDFRRLNGIQPGNEKGYLQRIVKNPKDTDSQYIWNLKEIRPDGSIVIVRVITKTFKGQALEDFYLINNND